jgi:hypothetical protein
MLPFYRSQLGLKYELQPEELIKNIRAKFEDILNFVSGEEASKATADHIERNLFKFLLAWVVNFFCCFL